MCNLSKSRVASLRILWSASILVGRPNLCYLRIFWKLIDINNLWFHFHWKSQVENFKEIVSDERSRWPPVQVRTICLRVLPECLLRNNCIFVKRASSDLLDYLLSGSWCNSVTTVPFWCCGTVLLGPPGDTLQTLPWWLIVMLISSFGVGSEVYW